jgi:Na+-transporting methylmalonyl-CoA/oxaloacetate decarboxylase gamma subunit
MNWRNVIPFAVGNLLRGAVRAILGLTLVFIAMFLCWFTMELLSHLKDLLARTIFHAEW